MKRVLVIGSSGAGKSTFSRKLHEITKIELIHLDKIYWRAGWNEPPKPEWKQTVEETLKKENWIMDGNYSGTMEMRIQACDTVIFLDLSRIICVYRILKRVVFYRKGKRPDMAEGCHERFDWEFVKWVWDYPTRSKPKIEELLRRFENEKTVIRLKSKTEIRQFLSDLDGNRCFS